MNRKTINLKINSDIYTQLDSRAKKGNLSKTRIVEQALTEYFSKDEGEESAAPNDDVDDSDSATSTYSNSNEDETANLKKRIQTLEDNLATLRTELEERFESEKKAIKSYFLGLSCHWGDESAAPNTDVDDIECSATSTYSNSSEDETTPPEPPKTTETPTNGEVEVSDGTQANDKVEVGETTHKMMVASNSKVDNSEETAAPNGGENIESIATYSNSTTSEETTAPTAPQESAAPNGDEVSTNEMAKRYGIPASTFRGWVDSYLSQGKLPQGKIKGKDKSDIWKEIQKDYRLLESKKWVKRGDN